MIANKSFEKVVNCKCIEIANQRDHYIDIKNIKFEKYSCSLVQNFLFSRGDI
jgi:hypothetical protein